MGWTGTLYSAPTGSLAPPEPLGLHGMQFGADLSKITPAGKIASAQGDSLADAIKCMSAEGDFVKCEKHFDGLAKLGGYEEEVKKTTTQSVSAFCGRAGSQLLW